MPSALDKAISTLPVGSIWRVKPGRPFTADVSVVYGSIVKIREVLQARTVAGLGVRFQLSGKDEIQSLSRDTFQTWYDLCHQEGQRCSVCPPPRRSPGGQAGKRSSSHPT